MGYALSAGLYGSRGKFSFPGCPCVPPGASSGPQRDLFWDRWQL